MVCATTFLDANRGQRKRDVEARGQTAPKVIRTNDEAWRALPIEFTSTLEEAIARAIVRAVPGDAVLLSPACASLDMFRDYADRGDRFKAAVAAHARDAAHA